MAKLKCKNDICAINWLDQARDRYVPVRAIPADEGNPPVFVFRRQEDGRHVVGIYCKDHVIFGMYLVMKLSGCEA